MHPAEHLRCKLIATCASQAQAHALSVLASSTLRTFTHPHPNRQQLAEEAATMNRVPSD